jgi:uncharacterized protein YukE
MSLDETYQALSHFARELRGFDETIRASHSELARLNENLSGLWTDSARVDYDRALADLELQLDRYVGSQSEEFERFLDMKISQLRTYLEGS